MGRATWEKRKDTLENWRSYTPRNVRGMGDSNIDSNKIRIGDGKINSEKGFSGLVGCKHLIWGYGEGERPGRGADALMQRAN